MYMHYVACAALFLSLDTTTAMAEGWPPVEKKITIHTPSIGEQVEVPAGSNIYSNKILKSMMGAELLSELNFRRLFKIIVKQGVVLEPDTSNKSAKYCTREVTAFNMICLYDSNSDNIFDEWLNDSGFFPSKLKEPIPYRLVKIAKEQDSDRFNYVILYQGATADTIKFSYREFSNDLARPAFTEEINIPREPFPAMIRIKNLQIEVLNISGLGMKYKIVKAD
jgi:hypothetical protein